MVMHHHKHQGYLRGYIRGGTASFAFCFCFCFIRCAGYCISVSGLKTHLLLQYFQ